MAHLRPSLPVSQQIRRALGALRRSKPVQHAAVFLAVQGRRAGQRMRARFVRGVWLRTERYIARNRHRPRGPAEALVAPATRTVIAPPSFVPGAPPTVVGGSISIYVPPRRVSRLDRAWVIGPGGAVVASDRKLLWDLSYEWPGHAHRHSAYDLTTFRAERLPGVTVTLAAMAADTNYFHFLLNSVARLAYLDQLNLPERPERYLVSGRVTCFVAEALALFGLPPERVVGIEKHEVFLAERLVAPPLIQHPFVVPEDVCAFFRRAVEGLPPATPQSRRIFIDRGDTSSRRIRNLEALQPLLAEAQIELLRLSGLSVAQQASLFKGAELVIANHGAALSNLVFCAPGTRVLQILAPGMMEREYRTISQHGRLRHDYIVADFADDADVRLPRKQRDLVLLPGKLHGILAAEGWLS